MTAGSRRMAMANPADAQLGLKPSAPPPLNPGVAHVVAPPILAHYRQTAALAGSAGPGSPARGGRARPPQGAVGAGHGRSEHVGRCGRQSRRHSG